MTAKLFPLNNIFRTVSYALIYLNMHLLRNFSWHHPKVLILFRKKKPQNKMGSHYIARLASNSVLLRDLPKYCDDQLTNFLMYFLKRACAWSYMRRCARMVV